MSKVVLQLRSGKKIYVSNLTSVISREVYTALPLNVIKHVWVNDVDCTIYSYFIDFYFQNPKLGLRQSSVVISSKLHVSVFKNVEIV